jgi:hypothetical protein
MIAFEREIHRDRFKWKNPDWKFIKKIRAIWMRYPSTGVYFEYEIEESTSSGDSSIEFIRIVDLDFLEQLKKALIHFEPCGAVRNAIILGTMKLTDEKANQRANSTNLIPKEFMEDENKEIMVLSTLAEWKKYIADTR